LEFERKITRRIFDPTKKENGEWRPKTNEELEEAINNENIVKVNQSRYRPEGAQRVPGS
jgi:hypothetical protein